MRALLCLLCVVACAVARADEFSIDTYDFDWTVKTSDDAKLLINKTAERTAVVIRDDFRSLTLTPEAAVRIGAALEQTEAMFQKLKGKNEAAETVDAGDYRVTFRTSKTGSFYAVIGSKESSIFPAPQLDRAQAKAFAPELKKAKSMCEYVDKKVAL